MPVNARSGHLASDLVVHVGLPKPAGARVCKVQVLQLLPFFATFGLLYSAGENVVGDVRAFGFDQLIRDEQEQGERETDAEVGQAKSPQPDAGGAHRRDLVISSMVCERV